MAGWYDLPELNTHEENFITLSADAPREDRWIVHRLNVTVSSVNAYLIEYQLGEAQRTIYEFLWGDFCDWYIEMAKVRLQAGDPTPSRVLAHVLERTLRLLHPFMPFITEEIWQNLLLRLPKEGDLPESIMVAPYPQPEKGRIDHQADQEMLAITLMIQAIRNARAQLRVPSAQRLEAMVDPNGLRKAVEEESAAICTLARVQPLQHTR